MDSEISSLWSAVCRFAAAVLSLTACGAPLNSSGHPVEQIFLEFDREGSGWEAEVLFDAAFALPEFRESTDEPPPEREWLVGLPEKEHARIRDGAAAYLRERICFRLGEKELSWKASFPDYESTPPDFPKLLNGGAYTRVRLRGALPDGATGEVSLEVAEGPGPSVVVAIDPKGEPRYFTVPPREKVGLLEIETSRSPGWRTVLLTFRWQTIAAIVVVVAVVAVVAVIAVVAVVAWMLVKVNGRG